MSAGVRQDRIESALQLLDDVVKAGTKQASKGKREHLEELANQIALSYKVQWLLEQ
jgi:hypothetical protein